MGSWSHEVLVETVDELLGRYRKAGSYSRLAAMLNMPGTEATLSSVLRGASGQCSFDMEQRIRHGLGLAPRPPYAVPVGGEAAEPAAQVRGPAQRRFDPAQRKRTKRRSIHVSDEVFESLNATRGSRSWNEYLTWLLGGDPGEWISITPRVAWSTDAP